MHATTLNVPIVIAIFVVALGAILWKPVFKVLNHFITLIHELGHAVFAFLLGGRVQGIRIESNGSGSTVSGQAVKLGYTFARVVTLLAGYSFPITFSIILFATVLTHNLIACVITIAIAFLITLLFIRNLFGLAITLFFGAVFISTYFLLQPIYLYIVLFLAFLSLLGGAKDIAGVSKMVFTRNPTQGQQTDFDFLQEATHIPRGIWFVIFIILMGALITGVFFLVQYINR
jgi:hypothetical protein